GNARAISFRHPPIVRMTNTYIAGAPGGGSFDDLIGDVKLGVYACGAFGGQTMLENFSFTAAYGRMIRDGRVAELVKDVVLAGNLFQTLDRIDHITPSPLRRRPAPPRYGRAAPLRSPGAGTGRPSRTRHPSGSSGSRPRYDRCDRGSGTGSPRARRPSRAPPPAHHGSCGRRRP